MSNFVYLQRPWLRSLLFVAGAIFLATLVIWGLVAINRYGREQWLSTASLEALQEAHKSDPNDQEIIFRLAYRLLQQQEAARALPLMEQLVQREPRSPRYWHGLALCAAHSGRATEAAHAYRTTLDLDPAQASAHASLGQIYAEAGLTTDALQEFERAAKSEADSAVSGITGIWAKCLMEKGRMSEAWEKLMATIAKQPIHEEAYVLLTEAGLSLGKDEVAEEYLRRRIGLTSMYPMGKLRAALVRLLLSRSQDARTLQEAEDLARTAVNDPDPKADYHALLGRVLLLREDLAGARSALNAGLKLQADHTECLKLLAEVRERQGDLPEAKRLRARLVAREGKDPALSALRRNVSASPESVEARLALASALAKTGDYGAAAEECHEALRRAPGNPAAAALLDSCRSQALEKLTRSNAVAKVNT